MEIKKTQSRGRPKKDYGDLKNKIAQKTAENKGKLGRGRPKKEKKIDDSVNTKILNHHKEVNELEKKNNEIHTTIDKITKFYEDIPNVKKEKYSRIFLGFSMAFFICAIAFAITYKLILPSLYEGEDLSVETPSKVNNEETISLQIGYNDQNGEFVEIENVEIDKNDFKNEQEDNSVDNEYTDLIMSFYDKINNREFSSLPSMADNYLKKSDSYRTYYNENRLSKFLDKLVGNRIYVGGFKELESTKPNVKKYGYVIKYKVKGNSELTREEREIAIVNRNEENLIGSIMCVTTGCSRMPFFQP